MNEVLRNVRGVNLPRGKQAGIRYGQKKQNGQSDLEQLIDIRNWLKNRWKINAKREYYVVFDKETERIYMITDHVNKEDLGETIINDDGYKEYNQTRFAKNPDLLWIDKNGLWIIEVDGAVHDRNVKKTNERNELYISNSIKLIVVNLSDLKELKINIYDYIDQQIKAMI